MKKTLSFLLLVAVMVASCESLWYYRSIHEFDDHTWMIGDTVAFEKEVEEARTVKLDLMFRHVYGFPYKDLGLYFEMTGPDGQTTSQELTIPIIGEDGQYLGEGAVDIWDVEQTVTPNLELKPGTYHFRVAHRMAKKDLQLVMEMGIRMEKVE